MTNVLDTIDLAIKRLVSPVAMLVAAGLLSRGLAAPESSELVIKSLMILLGMSAIAYMAFSAREAIRSFGRSGMGAVSIALVSAVFVLVYLIVFASAIKFGFDKIAH